MKSWFKKINIVFIIIILLSSICIIIIRNPKDNRIKNIIKKHNSINKTNPSFPMVNKPPSSLKTVFRGDSIRVLPKK
jgi:hypothetical protein|tara:strand:- start:154 stop:384 length:231 start_codon:yes stop_codon:yes gene_type:complete